MIDNKILENTAMSDEELDGVAGGFAHEAANDSRFLNSLNGSCDRYGTASMVFVNVLGRKKEIEKAWATVGIEANIKAGFVVSSNDYYLNGQPITQEQARQHAMNVVGKQMSESDWKW